MKNDAEAEQLEALQELVRRFRDERDWEQFHTPKDLAAAIAIEAAELQELFLWQDADTQATTVADRNEAVRHEIADVVILALAFAEATGIDLGAAILEKLRINEDKYPADQVRGSAVKYTNLSAEN